MKYLNGKEFNPQDYRYGAWFTDPCINFFKCLLRLDRLPVAAAVPTVVYYDEKHD